MEKSRPAQVQNRKPYSAHDDAKWVIEDINEHVESRERRERILQVLDSYSFDAANSIAHSMRYSSGAREMDRMLGFLSKPDVHSFLDATAHGAGDIAYELLAVCALPDGDRLLGPAIGAIARTRDTTASGGSWNIEYYAARAVRTVAERFSSSDIIDAIGAMVSGYPAEARYRLLHQLWDYARKQNTDMESIAAFIKVFRDEGTNRFINTMSEFGLSDVVIKEAVARTKSRLRSKDKGKAVARALGHISGMSELLCNESMTEVFRAQGEHGNQYSVYNAFTKMRGMVGQEAISRIASTMVGMDPEAALDVMRAFQNVLERLSDSRNPKKARELTDAEVGRALRLAENYGKYVSGDENSYTSTETIVEMLRNNLDRLVTDKMTFAAVRAYLKSGRMLPAPTAENISNYEGVANAYLKQRYGLEKELSVPQIDTLFSLDGYNGGEEAMRQGAIYFVNKAREENVRHYSITMGGSAVPIDYPKETLTRYAVLALISPPGKDAESEGVVAQIVGERAVNRARNSFNTSHRRLLPGILREVKESNFEGAASLLRQTNDEAIMDVLNSANYREVNIGNAKFVRAAENKNPLDYDSRVQIACVYMPSGKHIFEYCADDRVTLVRYEVGGRALGSAICYLEDNVFLVDSVEGHRTFRKPGIFDVVYEDLVERARAKGAVKILFSTDSSNETPGEFEDYLKSKGLKETVMKMRLATNTYLEADGDGVSGYVVELVPGAAEQKGGISDVLRKE